MKKIQKNTIVIARLDKKIIKKHKNVGSHKFWTSDLPPFHPQPTALATENQALFPLEGSVRHFLYSGVWMLAKRDPKLRISVFWPHSHASGCRSAACRSTPLTLRRPKSHPFLHDGRRRLEIHISNFQFSFSFSFVYSFNRFLICIFCLFMTFVAETI